MKTITVNDIKSFKIAPGRKFFSATHEEIEKGLTSDIYFVRTRDILENEGLSEIPVAAEIFCSRAGILAGVEEVINLLSGSGLEVSSVPEGEPVAEKEVVMRIAGPYGRFGVYETVILGMLSSSSGWATAARKCKDAAGDKTVVCFGARHVHPSVAPVMERAALVGGVDGCSCILGAKLVQKEPTGTIPHALFLILGDTVEVSRLYDQLTPPEHPRFVLVDTFKDEAEEALRVARFLKEKLDGVRLDTPAERGGVTPSLVREVRARLDQAGYEKVRILVSGGITGERITILSEAGADAFGVGSYISRSPAIDMTMDLKVVNGKDIAKRGRIPGLTDNPRLQKIIF